MSEYRMLLTFRTGEINLTDNVLHNIQCRSGVAVLYKPVSLQFTLQ